MLAKAINKSHTDCNMILGAIVACYNGMVNSLMGFTPNLLFTGREALMPLDLISGTTDRSSNHDGTGNQ